VGTNARDLTANMVHNGLIPVARGYALWKSWWWRLPFACSQLDVYKEYLRTVMRSPNACAERLGWIGEIGKSKLNVGAMAERIFLPERQAGLWRIGPMSGEDMAPRTPSGLIPPTIPLVASPLIDRVSMKLRAFPRKPAGSPFTNHADFVAMLSFPVSSPHSLPLRARAYGSLFVRYKSATRAPQIGGCVTVLMRRRSRERSFEDSA
jgi:hypothetical protein